MRICMVISTPFPPEEGIGYHVYNLSKKLIERGHETTVITRGPLTKETDFLDGIEIIRVPFIPLYPFHVTIHGFFVNNLFKSIEGEFDIVHVHTPLPPIIKTSLPIVSTIHGSMVGNAQALEKIDLKSFGSRVMTRWVSYPLVYNLIKKSKVVTTVSYSVAQELERYYGVDNAVVVGNGVDEKAFTPVKEKSNEMYILYVGRLSPGKGLFDLLECAKLICHNHNIKFFLAGKGELGRRLKRKIRNQKLENNIFVLGYIEHDSLNHLYQNASIFVLPSCYEGLPTALLEAMACGLPVVVTSVSGNKDVVKAKYNGLSVSPKSPEQMAGAITQLIEDKELRNTLGRNARKTIEKDFTWDSVTDRVEKCYNFALKSL